MTAEARWKEMLAAYATTDPAEGGFLVPPEIMDGGWKRRAWPIRLWRRLRGQPLDDWMPGIRERVASIAIARRQVEQPPPRRRAR